MSKLLGLHRVEIRPYSIDSSPRSPPTAAHRPPHRWSLGKLHINRKQVRRRGSSKLSRHRGGRQVTERPRTSIPSSTRVSRPLANPTQDSNKQEPRTNNHQQTKFDGQLTGYEPRLNHHSLSSIIIILKPVDNRSIDLTTQSSLWLSPAAQTCFDPHRTPSQTSSQADSSATIDQQDPPTHWTSIDRSSRD